jgi:hypothetical protein
MTLLHAIYDSPVDLLDKARRDGQALTQALSNCDKSAVQDSLFNFAISTYHLWDWIKAFNPELKDAVNALLDDSASLQACRDLCNASKHINLISNRSHKKQNRQYPLVVEDVDYSATARTSLPNMKGVPTKAANQDIDPAQPSWRLKIQMRTGQRFPAEDLVSDALSVWEKFFAEKHIQ